MRLHVIDKLNGAFSYFLRVSFHVPGPLRKGDEVKILRGDEKGKIGKIVQLSRKGIFIYINTITYKKMKGDENYLPIHPSNVEILNLILTPERKEYLSRIALIAKKFR